MIDYEKVCIQAAISGARAVKSTGLKESAAKLDILGHHSIITDADYNSQKAILEVILSQDSDSFFMTEEHVPELLRGKTITLDNLERLRDSGVYVIDELDGTSSRRVGHYEWSVSVGFVKNLVPTAGAISAPDIFSGALFYASRNNGAFMQIGKNKTKLQVNHNKLSDSYLIFGVDNFLTRYTLHNQLIHKLADQARTSNTNGSCALPLGLVAAGKADALIQPPQSPWDYAAGRLLVEEAGGKVIFYEMNNGKINPLEDLQPRHYNPEIKSVGFIAANPNLAQNILETMLSLNK